MKATPWGFRDILPEEALVRERIQEAFRAHMRGHGYLPVETPLIEDPSSLDTEGRETDAPFKLFDDDGRLLVVRPDNTPPIARLVATRLSTAELPLRLRYEAPVVRAQARDSGAARQFTQLGFELIGCGGAAGDVEMVSLVADVLRALELPSWRIVCGSVRPFQELLARCADDALARDALALVHANNFVDLDARLADSAVPEPLRRALSALPRLSGGRETLDRVDELTATAGIEEPQTAELRALLDGMSSAAALSSAGAPAVDEAISFDFSLMNSFDYYTGLVFKAYAGESADPVGSGGRYDATFDGVLAAAPCVPAAGFAFSLERLADACASGGDAGTAAVGPADTASRAPLRIAVPKGSLKGGTVEALEAAGFDASELCDPGRRLIVRGADRRYGMGPDAVGDVEFVIVRATDAPAFVAGGGADCGFCGRDSLIEADLKLLELIDMGYGACRFIEAEPAGRAGAAERAYARRGTLRVATKYPRIARAWYERRGIAADIVTLHGNIELGPIVGMTDRIVDITATGTTLAENDLVVTGEIMKCTARFFANPGRARLDPRVLALARRLEAALDGR